MEPNKNRIILILALFLTFLFRIFFVFEAISYKNVVGSTFQIEIQLRNWSIHIVSKGFVVPTDRHHNA